MKPSWRRLPFRKLIGDPFGLARRPLTGAIGTLTIRGGESPSVVLHHRDGGRVAGGGMLHLLPARDLPTELGMPDCVARDFSLWHNIQQEYAEELLGHQEEYDGTGCPIDYDTEPFATMDTALAEGWLRAYCLGITLDALTLAADILTVVIIEPELYDELFANAIERNNEGTIPIRIIPFEGNTLSHLREVGCLAPGAAALQLAWHHRHRLIHVA